MSEVGYIKLHRCIKDCQIWDDEERFDKRSAWIDLLLSANHKEKTILLGMKEVTIYPGQTHTSVQKLAEKWHWDRKTVMRYLDFLERTSMIRQERTPKGTTITIVKWAFYQQTDVPEGQQKGQQEGHQKGHKQEYINTKEKILPKGNIQKKAYPYEDVIKYLNEKTGKKFRVQSKESQKLIRARMDEGFTIDDFTTVIDVKTREWLSDPKMANFLQPSTLFSAKHFEEYLNQRGAPGNNRVDIGHPDQYREYDMVTDEIFGEEINGQYLQGM